MKKLLFLVVLLLVSNGCSTENSSLQEVVKNQDTPWSIAFLPNGGFLFTERPGSLNFFDGKVHEIAKLPVTEISEAGLLGVAVDPDFESNNHIYVYYTYEGVNRVSRFIFNNSISGEKILIDNIPSARFHNGGRIKFGPDGKLYVTTGDATEPSSAQDIESIAGKILRLNKDGSVPEDNPFGNYVWSYGHRNSQGIAWKDGVMYASEHGPRRHDEINIIQKGGNYGWPDRCGEQANNTIEPIRCYTEFTLAPSGIAFDGDLYVAALRGTQVRKLTIKDNKVISETEFISDMGRIRTVVENQGNLYFATNNRDGRGIPRQDDDKIVGDVNEKNKHR